MADPPAKCPCGGWKNKTSLAWVLLIICVPLLIINYAIFLPSSEKVKLAFRVSDPPQIPKILWWSTVRGQAPTFFTIGKTSEDLKKLASTCKFKCEYTVDKSQVDSSQVLLFYVHPDDLRVVGDPVDARSPMIEMPSSRQEIQYYVGVYMEPADVMNHMHTNFLRPYAQFFNWTMSYRYDSNFVLPYVRILEKDRPVLPNLVNDTKKIIADVLPPESLRRKKNLIAWMVSNCNATNGRNELVEELKKHIPITLLGSCFGKPCKDTIEKCFQDLGRTHKFYLAFENALCEDFVTEQFYYALKAGMVPVVYGKANYGYLFPPASFISIENFPSAYGLSFYLEYLNQNDDEYLKYFDWHKEYYAVRQPSLVPDTFCRLCKALHGKELEPVSVNIAEFVYQDKYNNSMCVEESQVFI